MAIKFHTPALPLLEAWLGIEGHNQTKLGNLVGVSSSAVSRWASGDSRPEEGHQRREVEAVTGIPEDAWKTNKERSEEAERLERIRRGLPAVEPRPRRTSKSTRRPAGSRPRGEA